MFKYMYKDYNNGGYNVVKTTVLKLVNNSSS